MSLENNVPSSYSALSNEASIVRSKLEKLDESSPRYRQSKILLEIRLEAIESELESLKNG